MEKTKRQISRARGVRAHQTRVREAVINHYGGKCACCGEAEPSFLMIDHVNNDGAIHRKQIGNGRHLGGTHFYQYLYTHGYPADPPLQVLCANCNQSKMKYGQCIHQLSGLRPNEHAPRPLSRIDKALRRDYN